VTGVTLRSARKSKGSAYRRTGETLFSLNVGRARNSESSGRAMARLWNSSVGSTARASITCDRTPVSASLTTTWGAASSNARRSSSRTTRTPPSEVSTNVARLDLTRFRRGCWGERKQEDPNAKNPSTLVERNFVAPAPNRLWVADITYIPTWAGLLYLAVVLDVFSRRIVGWAMETHLRTELVLKALNMALGQRRPAAVIHHSDQGSQGRFKRSLQYLDRGNWDDYSKAPLGSIWASSVAVAGTGRFPRRILDSYGTVAATRGAKLPI